MMIPTGMTFMFTPLESGIFCLGTLADVVKVKVAIIFTETHLLDKYTGTRSGA